MGIRPRAEIGSSEQAKPYLDMGVRDFCIGWDVRILFDCFKESGKAMRDLLADAAKNAPSTNGQAATAGAAGQVTR